MADSCSDRCRTLVPKHHGHPVRSGATPVLCFAFVQHILLSGVIHKGVESGEILAQPPLGGAGRPEGQNLGAIVAPCG